MQVGKLRVHREVLMAVLLSVALVICRALAAKVLFLYDDAFITFRYARNLSSGFGLVYNPGEWVLGTTAPAYALIASIGYLLHLPMPASMVWFNISLDVGVLLVTLFFVLKDEPLMARVVFGVLYSLSPLIARITVGGMEMSLYLLVSLLAIWYYQKGKDYTAIIVASLAYFIRPESGFLVLILVGWTLKAKHPGRALRMTVVSLATVAIPLSIICVTYGHLLSQSVIAKAGMAGRSTIGEVVHAFLLGDPICKVLLAFAVFGAFETWRSGDSAAKILIVWVVSFTLFYLITRPMTVASWYAELPLYCLIVFGAVGIVRILKLLHLDRVLERTGMAAVVGSIAVVALWIAIYAEEGPSVIDREVYQKLEAWCKTHTTQKSSVMAVDIGAIGYYSNSYVYDIYGLVSPEMLAYRHDTDAVKALRPDFIYHGYVAAEMHDHVTSEYVEAASFIPKYTSSDRLMKHWFAEYHLYQRK